jgi:hypothetical protein
MDKPVFQFEPLPGASLGVGEYSFSYTYTETREVGPVGHRQDTQKYSGFEPWFCLSLWMARCSSLYSHYVYVNGPQAIKNAIGESELVLQKPNAFALTVKPGDPTRCAIHFTYWG